MKLQDDYLAVISVVRRKTIIVKFNVIVV